MHNYQKAVTAELLASMSPIIFAQNQCLLSYISEEFDIPLEILKKKTNPRYLDFVSVYINKEKTSLSTVFPEMKVLTPMKDQCLARIKSGDHTHQCPHPCKDGKFCSSHKTKRSWGTVDQPFVCSQQSIIMKLQSSEKVKAKKEKIVEEQEDYIQGYINDFENIMLSNDYTNDSTGYASILNIDSFIDFILMQELSKNVDAYRLSTYIYKDKESVDNRLTAGPVWDFNHGFGNCDYGETWEVDNWLLEYNPEGGDQMAFWWELLWEDEEFQLKVAERYTELRNSIQLELLSSKFNKNNNSIPNDIDSILKHFISNFSCDDEGRTHQNLWKRINKCFEVLL